MNRLAIGCMMFLLPNVIQKNVFPFLFFTCHGVSDNFAFLISAYGDAISLHWQAMTTHYKHGKHKRRWKYLKLNIVHPFRQMKMSACGVFHQLPEIMKPCMWVYVTLSTGSKNCLRLFSEINCSRFSDSCIFLSKCWVS
jgi:hypothetical protein